MFIAELFLRGVLKRISNIHRSNSLSLFCFFLEPVYTLISVAQFPTRKSYNRDHDIYSLCKSNFSTFYSVFAAMKLRRTQCLRTKTTNSYALRSSFFADSFLLRPSSLWSGVHIIDRVINLLIRTKIIQTHRAKKTDHIIGWISCNRKVWFSRLENEIISSPNH